MKRGWQVIALLFGILMFPLVSAGFYISQPEAIYNIGDYLDVNVTINPVIDGPLKLKLICDDKDISIFNGPPIESISLPLTNAWIGDLTGNCKVSGEYAGDKKETNPGFLISRELKISLSIESLFTKPGEIVKISGSVKKLNGLPSDGEIEINVPFLKNLDDSNDSYDNVIGTYYGTINNGKFNVEFRLPENTATGEYNINLKAYENNEDSIILNEGLTSILLKVPQVLRDIDLAVSNQNFNPGDKVTIKPTLLDQTGNPIKDQVTIKILNSNSSSIYEKIGQSEQIFEYTIPTNLVSGYYSIQASSGEVKSIKSFFVNEKAIAKFEIVNDSLKISNVGNVVYKKDIQVEIDKKPFIKKLELGVGETKEFKLTGPTGSYDVKVSDGETSLEQSRVVFPGTGKSFDIRTLDEMQSSNSKIFTPIIWVILIAILTAIMLFLVFSVYKKKSVAYPSDYKPKKTLKLEGIPKSREPDLILNAKPSSHQNSRPMLSGSNMPDNRPKNPIVSISKRSITPSDAVQSMVVAGQKSRASIVAIKLKSPVSDNARKHIESLLNIFYERKGTILEQGSFILAIFSPIVTKTFKNEIEAARTAEKFIDEMKEYNRKFNDSVDFGVGVNSGEIINEISDAKLKLTALGNSMILSKKLSELSNQQLFISKDTYEKAISEIKADKVKVNEIDVYEVRKIVDYDKNKKFIDDFIKRNARENSKRLGFMPPNAL